MMNFWDLYQGNTNQVPTLADVTNNIYQTYGIGTPKSATGQYFSGTSPLLGYATPDYPSLFGIPGLGGGDLLKTGAGLLGMWYGNKLAKQQLQMQKDAINANIYNQNLVANKDLERMKTLAEYSNGGKVTNPSVYEPYKPKYI